MDEISATESEPIGWQRKTQEVNAARRSGKHRCNNLNSSKAGETEERVRKLEQTDAIRKGDWTAATVDDQDW
jgi:hypothetical protein